MPTDTRTLTELRAREAEIESEMDWLPNRSSLPFEQRRGNIFACLRHELAAIRAAIQVKKEVANA
jgi:hypothetical protein